MRSVVVFPAPFGPRKPVIVPGASANERPSTASSFPKRLLNDSASTAGSISPPFANKPIESCFRLVPPLTETIGDVMSLGGVHPA